MKMTENGLKWKSGWNHLFVYGINVFHRTLLKEYVLYSWFNVDNYGQPLKVCNKLTLFPVMVYM